MHSDKKIRQNIAFALAGFFFLFFAASVAQALDTPVLPTVVTGALTVDGNPAPVNTTITAKIEGVLLGEQNTTKEGAYAIAVGGPAENAGKSIALYVNGIEAKTNLTWSSGTIEKADLSVTKKSNTSIYIALFALAFVAALFLRKGTPKNRFLRV